MKITKLSVYQRQRALRRVLHRVNHFISLTAEFFRNVAFVGTLLLSVCIIALLQAIEDRKRDKTWDEVADE